MATSVAPEADVKMILGLIAALVCVVPHTAMAQPPASSGDVAASYSFLRFVEDDGVNLPVGWLVSGSRRVGGIVSVVGEVGGNYRSEEGETLQLYTFQGGVRVSSPRALVRPFAQVLAGAATAVCCGESESRFVLEPGGGLDVRVNERTGFRLGVGFPVVFDDGNVTELFRFHAGVVVDFGGR